MVCRTYKLDCNFLQDWLYSDLQFLYKHSDFWWCTQATQWTAITLQTKCTGLPPQKKKKKKKMFSIDNKSLNTAMLTSVACGMLVGMNSYKKNCF